MDQDAIQQGIDTVVIPFPQRDVHLFQNAPSS